MNSNKGRRLVDVLLAALQTQANYAVQINFDSGYEMSSAVMVHKMQTFAKNLRKMGIKRGDPVTILSDRRDEFLPMCLGTMLAGAVPNPVDFRCPDGILITMLAQIRPKLIICEESRLAAVEQCLNELNLIVVDILVIPDFEIRLRPLQSVFALFVDVSDVQDSSSNVSMMECKPDETALIVMGRNASGNQCIEVSHSQSIQTLIQHSVLNDRDVVYSNDLALCFATIFNGATLIVSRRRATAVCAQHTLEIITLHRVTVLSVSRMQLNAICHKFADGARSSSFDVSSVRAVRPAASGVFYNADVDNDDDNDDDNIIDSWYCGDSTNVANSVQSDGMHVCGFFSLHSRRKVRNVS